MNKENKLPNNLSEIKGLSNKIGIPELDNLGFGLDKNWNEYIDRYKDTYWRLYWLKKNPPRKENFGLFDNIDLVEKDGYNVFGIFKDLIEYKDQKYSFEGIREILSKYKRKYKFPIIKEKKKIQKIPEKIKKLFDEFVLVDGNNGDFSQLKEENLVRVFYIFFLSHIYDLDKEEHKQQTMNFDLNK